MSDKKVAVIMSTYNGAKFIREQLDSILNQTYKNIDIVIRDDGSKDETIDIIKEYQAKHDNIYLEVGSENLGFIKSFFELLKITEADYYSYADQDDVWMENKIELCVNALDSLDQTVPNMAFGSSDYYDENMKFIGHSPKDKSHSFLKACYSCVSQGMTMVVNKRARDLIIENTPKTCFFHDWWTYLLCEGLGNVVDVGQVVVKYRRRKENATSEGRGYINLLIWRLKNLIFHDGMSDIRQQMINFMDYYYYHVDDEKQKVLELFVLKRYTFAKACKKAFYPKKIRNNLLDDFLLRLVFLIGVL